VATISGVTVNFQVNPRIITIPDTLTDVLVQDLHDTVRDIEDELHDGMLYPRLISSAGKEALGGGVTVGLTATLQDAQLEFADRATATSTGTATSPDANGTKLVDTSANFVADGIKRGDTIINFTDQSIATVISVDGTDTITHGALVDGTENDWDTSDAYKVYAVVQCNISGGNVVAVDAAQAEIDPVSPSAFTQVIRTAAASATQLDGSGVWDQLQASHATANTMGQVMQNLWAMAAGRIVETSEGVFDYYDRDDSTVLFTLTVAASERTRS